jgi:Ca2+-binding RTX toxin-like protein
LRAVGFGVSNDDSGMAICAAAPVQAVAIAAGAGNDELEIVTVAQPRYNKIVVPVRLDGGSGSDEINPDSGPTEAVGGAGNDQISRRCGAGATRLEGGRGSDAISACAPDTGDQAGGPAKVIVGGPGVDRIEGSAGRDRISGGGGYDAISGHGGPDRLDGGAGPDLLIGGEGNDRLLGRARQGRHDRLPGQGRDDRRGGQRQPHRRQQRRRARHGIRAPLRGRGRRLLPHPQPAP